MSFLLFKDNLNEFKSFVNSADFCFRRNWAIFSDLNGNTPSNQFSPIEAFVCDFIVILSDFPIMGNENRAREIVNKSWPVLIA